MAETEVKFKKMTRTTVFDEAVEAIKRSIRSGELKAGDRLPSEGKLAAMMGVGRGTVREALQVLIHLGLLVRTNKVTSVAPNALERLTTRGVFDDFRAHNDLMEMVELRKILEPEAVALAAERITAEGLAAMEEQFRRMQESGDDLESFTEQDNRFHAGILQASGNSLIVEILQRIQEPMRRSQSLVIHASRLIRPRSVGFHERILAALKARDRAAAKKQMLNHLLDIQKEMYALLKAEPR